MKERKERKDKGRTEGKKAVVEELLAGLEVRSWISSSSRSYAQRPGRGNAELLRLYSPFAGCVSKLGSTDSAGCFELRRATAATVKLCRSSTRAPPSFDQ